VALDDLILDGDVLLGVLTPEVEDLRHHHVGDLIVNRRSSEDSHKDAGDHAMPTPARSVLMALMSAPANPSATSPRTPKPGTWKTRAASTPAMKPMTIHVTT
jgi:hypothetical protein